MGGKASATDASTRTGSQFLMRYGLKFDLSERKRFQILISFVATSKMPQQNYVTMHERAKDG